MRSINEREGFNVKTLRNVFTKRNMVDMMHSIMNNAGVILVSSFVHQLRQERLIVLFIKKYECFYMNFLHSHSIRTFLGLLEASLIFNIRTFTPKQVFEK